MILNAQLFGTSDQFFKVMITALGEQWRRLPIPEHFSSIYNRARPTDSPGAWYVGIFMSKAAPL